MTLRRKMYKINYLHYFRRQLVILLPRDNPCREEKDVPWNSLITGTDFWGNNFQLKTDNNWIIGPRWQLAPQMIFTPRNCLVPPTKCLQFSFNSLSDWNKSFDCSQSLAWDPPFWHQLSLHHDTAVTQAQKKARLKDHLWTHPIAFSREEEEETFHFFIIRFEKQLFRKRHQIKSDKVRISSIVLFCLLTLSNKWKWNFLQQYTNPKRTTVIKRTLRGK